MGRQHDGKAVWHIVKESAKSIGLAKLAPHDLRRTCARLCHASGGELEQIQIPFGARLGANDRTISWLEAADSISRQRSHWHRAESLSWALLFREECATIRPDERGA